ncbi:hypothetical protein VTI74DRAFT_9985 [Chaetomium olivicolor]
MAPEPTPDHHEHKKKVNLMDASGAERKDEDDTATAILKKKKKPNQLMVTDAVNDDNSIIALSNNTMEQLQLFRGDTVLVRGKKRKDTVLIVLADDDLDDGSARINRVVRHNLRVKHGDIITIHPCPDITICEFQLGLGAAAPPRGPDRLPVRCLPCTLLPGSLPAR